MEVSLSWLSKGYKLLKPHKDLGQSHLQGSPTSGSSTAYVCSKGILPPSCHPPCLSPTHPCLYSTCPCLCEKSKRSHKIIFFILFPEKWANSQLQSLGEFPVWKSGNCQEWKAAASQQGLCCHWPKQQQKTATTTTTTKHATCAQAYTNTPTEPNQTDKASGKRGWDAHSGSEADPLAPCHGSPIPSPPHHHLSSAFCLL